MSKKENIKKYYANKYKKEKQKEYAISLIKNRYIDLENHIWENMIYRINKSFKVQNAIRNYSFDELIGCNKSELLEYLKSTNKSNIDIELYPEWEPDHIIPICSFNLKNIDNQKKCFNYKNIQVLSKDNNRIKNKYIASETSAA